ncbi:MAG TPA: tagaturonate reductase [Puia sp.]|nr:tagaturonate reductase [Puia sp.]
MQLSAQTLPAIANSAVVVPDAAIFSLPEKVLQFGTGVLLRGLPDYFIDKANRHGLFNGRVVVVKSTDSGDAGAFDRQDGLYTLCVRGIEDGHKVEENIISSAISRVLSARDQWSEILQLAHKPEMQIIVSNTTEVGIQLVEDDIRRRPPASFPGKLLAFLYERYKAFNGSADSGMVIVPTELIVDNGKKLASIVKELAQMHRLEASFIVWMESRCRFCSSLVDRIVPGRPDAVSLQQLTHDLGYTDDLIAIAEVYRLWAIEGDEKVRSVLSFAAADPGVIIEPDIEIYRELKLRLLNGTHTLSCGLAFLSGFGTVKNAMDDTVFSTFVADLMLKEIAPSIPYEVPLSEARDFGLRVLDRFRNPHLQHQWLSITMQYSSKIRMRVVPVLLRHYERQHTPPAHMALGFAAYLLFMRATKKTQDTWYGEFRGHSYPIHDDKAGYYAELWQKYPAPEVATSSLKDKSLWGADLSELPGFEGAVRLYLDDLLNKGAAATLAPLIKAGGARLVR